MQACKREFREAALSAPDLAMLDFAVKLTRTPSEMTEDDVKKLREQGFDDMAILAGRLRGEHEQGAVTGHGAVSAEQVPDPAAERLDLFGGRSRRLGHVPNPPSRSPILSRVRHALPAT